MSANPRTAPLQEDEWERESPEARKLRQLLERGEIIEDDPGTGVSETHWAPMPPRATKDLPTATGWWATRRTRFGESDWSIVEVIRDEHHQLWWSYGVREPAQQVAVEFGRMWSDRPYVLPR